MALYRFLFAPVLLAVAVVAGPRGGAERAPAPLRVEAPARIAPGPEARPAHPSLVAPPRADPADPARVTARR